MLSRHDLSLMFTSYANFEEGDFCGWILSSSLKRNFDPLLTSRDKAGEVFWSVYWYKCWQEQHKYAQSHLEAYLQESCYWAAKSFLPYLPNSNYALADCK